MRPRQGGRLTPRPFHHPLNVMQITGISMLVAPKKTTTTITYERGYAPDRYRVKTTDAPHPDLYAALKALRFAFAEVCQMEEAWCDDLRVRGLVMTDDEGLQRFTVLAVRDTEWGDMNVATPPFVAPAEMQGDLQDVFEQANAFLCGKRAQASLFDVATGDGQDTGIESVTISVPDVDGTPDGPRRSVTLTREGMANLSDRLDRELGKA